MAKVIIGHAPPVGEKIADGLAHGFGEGGTAGIKETHIGKELAQVVLGQQFFLLFDPEGSLLRIGKGQVGDGLEALRSVPPVENLKARRKTGEHAPKGHPPDPVCAIGDTS